MEQNPFKDIFIFKHYSTHDKMQVIKALDFAKNAHKSQKRANGDPYIVHPIAVAKIVLELKAIPEITEASLLHDTIEDTSVNFEDIHHEFGFHVAKIVNTVSKSHKIQLLEHNSEEERKALHHMFLETIKDPKSALVKVADRLNNIRTIDALTAEQENRISRETIKAYVPLAFEMGIPKIAEELHNLAKKHLDKKAYNHALEVMKKYDQEIKEKGYHKDAIDHCAFEFFQT